jgi:NitT/TauT family transport system substrate-binding protein
LVTTAADRAKSLLLKPRSIGPAQDFATAFAEAAGTLLALRFVIRPLNDCGGRAEKEEIVLAMKRFLFALMALIASNACVARADGLMPMKLGINKLGAMTSVWVASKEGMFKQHGLDVQITEIPLSDQSIPMLQSKSVDIVLQIPGTAFVAKERGFDIVLVGQNETAGTKPPVSNAIMVTPNSGVATIKDLKGKRIAVSSPHGQGFAAMKMLFDKAGISTDDVQMTPAPFTAISDLMRTNQVDAAVALDPYTTQIAKAGIGKTISWYMMETIPDQPVGSWWALRSWAQQHQKEIAAFNDGVKEAHAWLYADSDRAKQAVADYSGLDINLVKDMPMISWKADIDPKTWQALADMMYQEGELSSHHDVSEYLLN